MGGVQNFADALGDRAQSMQNAYIDNLPDGGFRMGMTMMRDFRDQLQQQNQQVFDNLAAQMGPGNSFNVTPSGGLSWNGGW